MSFDSTWLDLREPADRAARNPALRDAFANAAQNTTILDIGCGTGSTLRSIPVAARWILADNDPALLAEAAKRTDAETRLCDLNDLTTLPKADFITASALFDLCSAPFLQSLANHIPNGLYAALNYDGRIDWSDPHPQDTAILAAFNAHQRRDKGFGPALGPEAAPTLTEICRSHGLRVETAESPWHLTQGPLQTAFATGIANAASESGLNTAGWLAYRQSSNGSCRVGHIDLLALRHG